MEKLYNQKSKTKEAVKDSSSIAKHPGHRPKAKNQILKLLGLLIKSVKRKKLVAGKDSFSAVKHPTCKCKKT
jgi:hypothetical protein